MPELPEVETIVRGLMATIRGCRISRVEVCGVAVFDESPAYFVRKITNQIIQSIDRHGKSIFLQLEGIRLRVHLGMTGQLLLVEPSAPIQKHTHVIFHLDKDDAQLRYVDIRRFGKMELLLNGDIASRAPDAWNSSIDELSTALRNKKGFIKHALLNQHVIAGLGNIYVDESLYKAKIHPLKKTETLSVQSIRKLCRDFQSVLAASLRVGGTSFRNYVDVQGSRGGFKDRLLVYGKEGKKCRLCKSPICKTVVAGRGTHFCPQCQVLSA